jgi:hypothetical protein
MRRAGKRRAGKEKRGDRSRPVCQAGPVPGLATTYRCVVLTQIYDCRAKPDEEENAPGDADDRSHVHSPGAIERQCKAYAHAILSASRQVARRTHEIPRASSATLVARPNIVARRTLVTRRLKPRPAELAVQTPITFVSSLTAAADFWSAAFSSGVSLISMTRSAPPFPSLTGTPRN